MNPVAPRSRAADRYPHGHVYKYNYGCRCDACREAKRLDSRAYYRRRSWQRCTSEVDSAQVQRHLARLASHGLGTRTIADAAGVDRETVQDIRAGRRPTITRRVAFRLLRVNPDQAADHTLVDAAPTWALIDELREEGYSLHQLARLLGYSGRTVPIARDRCSARNAQRVRELHQALTGLERRPIPRTRPHYPANRIYVQQMHRSPA